jgi:hypothetical protein
MTKKTTAELLERAAVTMERKNAELAKAKAASRGQLLLDAESSVRDAARALPKGERLRDAEISVAADKPKPSAMVWDETVGVPDNVPVASKREAKPLWNEMAPSKADSRRNSRILTGDGV